ncbi:MAG: peptidylprolyl isomerase [Chloroflexi bacterium]|nr:peptidylprolyl isomerase [Chloroflexota bacterium]
MRRLHSTKIIGLVLLAAALIGCSNGNAATATLPLVSTATQLPSATVLPTPTEAPLAARVNGRPITLEAFQKEVARFEAGQAAIGKDPAALGDYRGRVLDDLINRELVAQAAAREGVTLTDSELQKKHDAVVTAAGGAGTFNAWLAANEYTADEFRAELRGELIAQALAAKVIDVPTAVEQVHARHILVTTEAEAQDLLARVQQGADFGSLARQFSQDLSTRPNGGELGWFARGELAVPEVEDAAFNLQPNGLSGVVHSALGFHLVQTLERDPARPLDPTALAALRQQAFDQWVAGQRAQATVEILAK